MLNFNNQERLEKQGRKGGVMSGAEMMSLMLGAVFGAFLLIFVIVFPISLRRSGTTVGGPLGFIIGWFVDPHPSKNPIAWAVLLSTALYAPLFGNSYSLGAWFEMITDPRGIILLLGVIFVAPLLIAGAVNAGMRGAMNGMKPWQKTGLDALMAALLVLSLLAHLFFFFGPRAQQAATPATPAAPAPAAPAPTPTPVPTPVVVSISAEVMGYEARGVVVAQLGPGEVARIRETHRSLREIGFAGNWYDTTPWGYKDPRAAGYFGGRVESTELYCYSDIEGVKAGETLIILGEPCEAPNEMVFQFRKGQNSIEVANATNKTLPLTLYFHELREPPAKASDFRGKAKFNIEITRRNKN